MGQTLNWYFSINGLKQDKGLTSFAQKGTRIENRPGIQSFEAEIDKGKAGK